MNLYKITASVAHLLSAIPTSAIHFDEEGCRDCGGFTGSRARARSAGKVTARLPVILRSRHVDLLWSS
jgi:hypothetical protein